MLSIHNESSLLSVNSYNSIENANETDNCSYPIRMNFLLPNTLYLV